MNVPIKPIQYGLNKFASSVQVMWGEIAVNSDNYIIKLLLKDTDNNLLDTVLIDISKEDYLELGEDKETRINTILANSSIVRK